MALRDRLDDAKHRLEEATGLTVQPRERLELLEASDVERRALQRELDLLAYTALGYDRGRPQELKPEERLRLVQKARVVWQKDPQAGAAVDLMNDFVFGRGIPKPKAADEMVQEVIDEAWDDPDNDLITELDELTALGTDLTLQSNLFVLVFDDGTDGKVKLGLLEHDLVFDVVRDTTENGRKILYYVAYADDGAEDDWDFGADAPTARVVPGMRRVVYYEHWRNIANAEEAYENGERDTPIKKPPASKVGEGRVFHMAVNRTTSMAFGHPTMDRLMRWYTAYNRFMDARVDLMEASAAFVMKRKVKGTPTQLTKMATQTLSRRSALGRSNMDPDVGPEMLGPYPASVINENEQVEHEPFNLTTNATNAAEDARMLGAQVSAATRFPRSYFGDAGASNLATATSLELPVLKAVETRQEFFERLVRFFVDRVIERAVDSGRIPTELTEEERAKLAAKKEGENTQAGQMATGAPEPGGLPGQPPGQAPPLQIAAAHEDAMDDEEDTERDLSFEFSMPSPLKRTINDLVTAIQSVAQTFDPNNTNVELSRILLNVALGEGLELEDPAGAVEKIFPEGYVDPALAAAAQPPADPNANPYGEFAPGAPGADGDMHTQDNPYGAPMRSRMPEELQMSRAVVRGRDGVPLSLTEAMAGRMLPRKVEERHVKRRREVEEDFDAAIEAATDGG